MTGSTPSSESENESTIISRRKALSAVGGGSALISSPLIKSETISNSRGSTSDPSEKFESYDGEFIYDTSQLIELEIIANDSDGKQEIYLCSGFPSHHLFNNTLYLGNIARRVKLPTNNEFLVATHKGIEQTDEILRLGQVPTESNKFGGGAIIENSELSDMLFKYTNDGLEFRYVNQNQLIHQGENVELQISLPESNNNKRFDPMNISVKYHGDIDILAHDRHRVFPKFEESSRIC